MASLAEGLQGGPYPHPDDDADLSNDLKDIVEWAAERSVMRFSSTSDRDSKLPSPTEGMVCVTGTGTALVAWLYANGAWREFSSAHALPEPTTTVGASTNVITATSWATFPNWSSTVNLVLPRAAWVQFTWSGLAVTIAGASTNADLRTGIALSGATTSSPQSPAWSAVAWRITPSGTGTPTESGVLTATKVIKCNEGTTVVTPQAYKNSSGVTCQFNYPHLQVTPLRWAS